MSRPENTEAFRSAASSSVGTEALFISRELSWLDFNLRVLDEAASPANPLLERLKFLAITGGNLDEFFMVRIAGLRQQILAGDDRPDPAGNPPSLQLELARRKILKLLRRQQHILRDSLLPELEKHGIRLTSPGKLGGEARERLAEYCRDEVLPVLTPLAVDRAHPFPLLNSGAIEIAVLLAPAGRQSPLRALVEVPEVLDRFIELPGDGGARTFVLLEEAIMANLSLLFPGAEVRESFAFRITRDMDFAIDGDGDDDLLTLIGRKLLERSRRAVVRVELPDRARGRLGNWLVGELAPDRDACYNIGIPLHLKNFSELAAKVRDASLSEAPWPPVVPAAFTAEPDIFKAIAERKSILLAPPYHSFSPLVEFINRAADDPGVLAIKQTLYRVSGNSPVVRALQRAAENGKQVTVLVELKARFDESNNIAWARALDESGAHVIYGVAGLKVHAKALLVIRREEGAIRRYVHLGTGNYNDRTAAQYTDLGILSCDPDLCFDAATLFNVLTGCASPPRRWRKVAVAPFGLREHLEWLIEREIDFARAGGAASITAKMNSLSDERMIRLIHRAADAGVKIDLVVRGICCCRPKPGQDNLRIVSIIDRYLEHSRVFIFGNGGAPEYYLASADLMTRNLDRRIELLFPVDDPPIRAALRKILDFELADTEKSRRLRADASYSRSRAENHTALRSQYRTYRFFKEESESELRGFGGVLRVFRASLPKIPARLFAARKKS